MSTISDTNYWKLQKEVLLSQLHTSENGLSDEEATHRLEEYGLNEVPSTGHRTSFSILLSQFKSPLVYVLIFASALSAFLGEITEAVIIVVIMLVNAVLGFALEHKSERAVDELRKYLSYDATVVRNGKKTVVDARKISEREGYTQFPYRNRVFGWFPDIDSLFFLYFVRGLFPYLFGDCFFLLL